MTVADNPAPAPEQSPAPPSATRSRRLGTVGWVVLAVAAIIGVAALSTYLTTPRPGQPLDPTSTSRDGTRALVTLLRDRGVEVIEAPDFATVERHARPDALIAVLPTFHRIDDDVLRRMAGLPGDRLLVLPTTRTLEALAPGVREAGTLRFGGAEPGCDLREATRAGEIDLGLSTTYEDAGPYPVTSCYKGALVRYTDSTGRTVTVVGAVDFLTNDGLLAEGNAALAMNLAGTDPRLIWYAPQHRESNPDAGTEIGDLLPPQLPWIVLQLMVAVVLLALWQGRRLGPLVAERLPVVVRASETVEGRGRLYRSRRARDRAADALRTAALQRLLPRLGLSAGAPPATVAAAIAGRCGRQPPEVAQLLYGPPPDSDDALVHLAHALDDIERQVAHS